MNLGIIATNISSKLGILSRKACMRYATEVGKKMADKSAELGRQVNFNEITEIISETIPKHCQPKIITTSDEIVKTFINTGFTQEQASSYFSRVPAAAGVFMNGCSKRPIYLPAGLTNSIANTPVIAHELTHALDYNCSPKGIYNRIKTGLIIKIGKLFNKNLLDDAIKNDLKLHKCEGSLSRSTSAQPKLEDSINEYKIKNAVKCEPNSKDFDRYINVSTVLNGKDVDNDYKLTTKNRYLAHIRDCIRETLGSSKNYGAALVKWLDGFKSLMDIEIPAYTVQNNVERYMLNLADNEVTRSETRAYIYRQAKKITKQEKISYIKNLLLGKLRKPKIYTSDKDIVKLAIKKEHKQHIKNIIKDSRITTEEKEKLFTTLKINPHLFDNPDVIYLSQVKDRKGFCFLKNIDCFATLNEEQLKKVKSVANYRNSSGINTYKENIFGIVDHPDFDKLISIIKIEIEGKNPYKGLLLWKISQLPSNKLISVYSRIQSAAVEGKDISGEIAKELGIVTSGHNNIVNLHGMF